MKLSWKCEIIQPIDPYVLFLSSDNVFVVAFIKAQVKMDICVYGYLIPMATRSHNG